MEDKHYHCLLTNKLTGERCDSKVATKNVYKHLKCNKHLMKYLKKEGLPPEMVLSIGPNCERCPKEPEKE